MQIILDIDDIYNDGFSITCIGTVQISNNAVITMFKTATASLEGHEGDTLVIREGAESQWRTTKAHKAE